ncbi:MAG: tetratricopeptide repeat protein [Armatimonadota bacterium]|nr:tetratricopeptide repeat protein [Armatimonadota bacterium]
MRPRTSLLIVLTVLGMLLAFGLQGCLFGGGGEEAAEEGGEAAGPPGGEAPGGMPGEMGGAPGEMAGPPGEAGPAGGGPPAGPEGGMEPGMPGEAAGPGMGMGAMPGEEAEPAVGGDAAALVKEGMNLKHQGRYTAARDKFEAAIAADASNVDAHWGLAWILAEMGETDKAIEQFETVKELGASPERIAEANKALDRLQ